MDEQLPQIVLADLRYLKDQWRPEVTDDSLRRSSVVLRRLLVEGEVLRTWRGVGLKGEPVIWAPDFEKMLAAIDLRKLKYALAGGTVTHREVLPEGRERLYKLLFAVLPVEGVAIPEEALEDRPCRLTDFMKAPCAFIRGELVSRRDLIKYVANKRGGAHYDPTRKTTEHAFSLLDEIDEAFQMTGGRQGVFFEFLGLVQQLVEAEDIGGRLVTELGRF